jgi:hypothetical protein
LKLPLKLRLALFRKMGAQLDDDIVVDYLADYIEGLLQSEDVVKQASDDRIRTKRK